MHPQFPTLPGNGSVTSVSVCTRSPGASGQWQGDALDSSGCAWIVEQAMPSAISTLPEGTIVSVDGYTGTVTRTLH
jgi:hypothetical protein